MDIKLDESAFLPTRAHPTDAGLDLRSPENVFIPAHGSRVIRTGVHIRLQAYTAGFIKSRSGMMVHHNIITDGVIDEGYSGEICVWLHNCGDASYYVYRGDRIAQLVIQPVYYDTPVVVEDLRMDESERGDAGFGSTGK